MAERCGNCDARLTAESRFTYKETDLCAECTYAYLSWCFDGGMVADPDLWAWIDAPAALTKGGAP